MRNVIDPLYMDNHILVVIKPAGVLIQGDKSGDATLLDQCKYYLKQVFNKPGDAFLGLVHRIDRPTTGVVVFARTSKAASRLSQQIRQRETKKRYFAIVEGNAAAREKFRDRIVRINKTSKIAEDGQSAVLSYHTVWHHRGLSGVDINLITGRHHQIRVQFASRNMPILGDAKYGAKKIFRDRHIALCAYSLSFRHPITDEMLTFEISPEKYLRKKME